MDLIIVWTSHDLSPSACGLTAPFSPPRLGPSLNHRKHCCFLSRGKEGVSRALAFLHPPLDSGHNLLSALKCDTYVIDLYSCPSSTPTLWQPQEVTSACDFEGKVFKNSFFHPPWTHLHLESPVWHVTPYPRITFFVLFYICVGYNLFLLVSWHKTRYNAAREGRSRAKRRATTAAERSMKAPPSKLDSI